MPPLPHFIGGSYQGFSPIVDAERTQNWYPELAPWQSGGTNAIFPTPPGAQNSLLPRLGYTPFALFPSSPIRAIFWQDGRGFAISGNLFGEFFPSGNVIVYGQIAADANQATISSNGQAGSQLFLVSGGHGYIFDLNLLTIIDVTSQTEFPAPASKGFFTDGYFGAFQLNSITFALSNLENGLIWNITQGGKAQVSESSDNILSAVVSHREIWFTGSKTTEVWSDIGTGDFPYAPIPGTLIERGIDGPDTLVAIDNSVMCVSQSADGSRDVVRANGYAFVVVSTPAISNILTKAPTMAGAYAWAYVQGGHAFYILTVPSLIGWPSFVFDTSTGIWHERGIWDPTAEAWTPDIGRCHAYGFDQHLVGDRQSGCIYAMTTNQNSAAIAGTDTLLITTGSGGTAGPGRSNLFGPGTVIVGPDKETASNPYVPGVIMTLNTGGVIGAVPSTVIRTTDGAVLSDGTMGVLQRQNTTEQTQFFIYDVNFNQISATTVFTGADISNSPPAPVSDFANTFYMVSPHSKIVKSISRTGVIGGTTWGPLATTTQAFCVLGTTIYYYDTSNNIATWNMTTNMAGSIFYVHTNFPSGIVPANQLRIAPGTTILCGTVNNNNTNLQEMWTWNTTNPGIVVNKTPIAGVVGNTDETMQVDVGLSSTVMWTRSYPGTDRLNGSQFQQIRLSDGVILLSWNQTITLTDGGVAGGVLPATCPFFPWSPTTSTVTTQINTQTTTAFGAIPGTVQNVPIRRVRKTAQMNTELLQQFFKRFELLFMPGIGETNPPGDAPQFSVRWSNDAGQTWSSWRNLSAGGTGAFGTRAFINNAGRGRNRVWEVSVTDPCLWSIANAFVQMEPGIS